MEITVTKRDGSKEPFDAGKLAGSILNSLSDCYGFGKDARKEIERQINSENCRKYIEDFIKTASTPQKRTETPLERKTANVQCVCMGDSTKSLKTHENVSCDICAWDLSKLAMNFLAGLDADYSKAMLREYRRLASERNDLHHFLRITGERKMADDVTDQNMLIVKSDQRGEMMKWDRGMIEKRIMERCGVDREKAHEIAKKAEFQIARSGAKTISTSHIREVVNDILIQNGMNTLADRMKSYKVPMEYVDGLMNTKNNENSNIVANNPEAVNLAIAEYVLKQWGLDTIFSQEVKKAHDTGLIHLHDLGYPHRVYCSSHSIEYIKKYGLKGICNLNTESKPAKTASVLTGHLNTYLASMQANYAGALGIAYINIFYAPYLVGMTDEELHQVAQELIFNGSQNAFSRGGQTLFLDFNIHSGIPSYLKTIPAIGPGGHYMARHKETGVEVYLEEREKDRKDRNGNSLKKLVYPFDYRDIGGECRDELFFFEVMDDNGKVSWAANTDEYALLNYGDFEDIARRFTRQLLKVWGEGDANGRIFEFPKCDFHVSKETFSDPEQHEIFLEACELASKNGSTYFIFDRDEVTLSACCRLRTTIDDDLMLRHPESMRFCGFQNVTVNIPHCAYQAISECKERENLFNKLLEKVDYAMDMALDAHLQKQAAISHLMSEPGRPLWQIGKKCCDGRPYVELDKATYIIGLIGVNDAIKFLYGQELHESKTAMQLGVELVSHMYLRTKEYGKRYGLKFTLEESPAESAARRLAKTDLVMYPEFARQIVKGGEENAYYTNSVHLSADADVSLVDRIIAQGVFHSIIESGAITHAFIGEEQPDRDAIASLVKEVFYRTQSAQLTFSPEFTFCQDCGHQVRGLLDKCPACGSTNVYGETRVVGYFSKIQNWNKSKRYGELVARQNGRYKVNDAE